MKTIYFFFKMVYLGFDYGFKEDNRAYYVKELKKLYKHHNIDNNPLFISINSDDIDTINFYSLYKTYLRYISNNIPIYFLNYLGFACILLILLELNNILGDFYTIYINSIGLIYAIYKLINVILKFIYLISCFFKKLKSNNNIYKHIPYIYYKLGFLLGFILFYILSIIYNIMALIFQLVILDVYLNNINPERAIGIKDYIKTSVISENNPLYVLIGFGLLYLIFWIFNLN